MRNIGLIICFFLCVLTMSLAQNYFNRIIEFPNKSPNPGILELDDENYIIGSINFIDNLSSSSIITVNKIDLSHNIFDYKGFAFGRNGLFVDDGGYYSFGNNFIDKSKLSFNIYNEDWEVENTFDYEPLHGRRAAFGSNLIDGFIYGPSRDESDSLDLKEVTLKKIALDGTEVWSKNYGLSDDYTFTWEVERSDDGNILMTARIEPPNFFGSQSRLYKIDTAGNILWTFTTIEEPLIATPCWVSALNNGEILVSRKLDYSQNWDHLLSGYYQYPPEFIWLDSDGKLIRDTLILSETQNELFISGHTSSEEGYTIVYGVNEPSGGSLQKGWLFKMDNDGEIIWSKTYLHPQFPDRDHRITDIEILENGDIVCLGGISKGGEKSEIWLFKINSNGCFGDSSCEDDLIYTYTKDISISDAIFVYPNPTSGEINFNDITNLKSYSILDLTGRVLIDNTKISEQIDLSFLPQGIYLITIVTSTGNKNTSKIFISN